MLTGTGKVTTTGNWFEGTKNTYDPLKYSGSAYNFIGSYGGYKGANNPAVTGALGQMLTGQLSNASQQTLNNQFTQNLAKIREGGYGMPLGAQMGLQTKAATENALSAATLGEQQRNFAITQNLGYEQLGQADTQYGYTQQGMQNRDMNTYNANQEQFGANYANTQAQLGNKAQSENKAGFFDNLLQGAAGAVVGGVTGAITGGISNLLFNPNSSQVAKGPMLGTQPSPTGWSNNGMTSTNQAVANYMMGPTTQGYNVENYMRGNMRGNMLGNSNLSPYEQQMYSGRIR